METTWEDRLRAAGLRVTRPRLSVLGVLAEHPHVDADTIATAARAVHPSISPQAVYGVLKALVGGGLARRIEPAGAPALYELRVGDNHHHLVCRECGVVADVDCAVGAAPCLTPSEAAGFVVDEAEVVFWGLCADCQVERRKHVLGSVESTEGVEA
ncbi:MAG: fur [Modestobacter sp.]|jgi:Fe2+ or Zn2+ uptake regulation protein|nr:fur [Modestobacter sp.]